MTAGRPAIPINIRREVLFEARHHCAVCCTGLPLQQAHVIPWSKSKEHSLENLIALCANCHGRADGEKWGVPVLRKYKRNPCILARRQNAPNENREAVFEFIEILIEKETAEMRAKIADLESRLAAYGEAPGEVQVIDVEPANSCRIRIKLPAIAARKIIDGINSKDPILGQFLEGYPIKSVAAVNGKSEDKAVVIHRPSNLQPSVAKFALGYSSLVELMKWTRECGFSEPGVRLRISFKDIGRFLAHEFESAFLPLAFPLNDAELESEEWTERSVILDSPAGKIIVIVEFNSGFLRQTRRADILAANTVDRVPENGYHLAIISLSRSLYRPVAGKLETEEHLRDRKCVLAHQWLEVMSAIFNGQRIQKRTIDGKAELFAIMATLNYGLPMEDHQEHWDDLLIGLREVLIPRGTLLEKLFKIGFETAEDFRHQFQSKASATWLMKLADIIGNEIHVDPKLIKERLLELILDPAPADEIADLR